MTNIIAGMHSYFWLTSSRLREPIQDEVPYTAQALRQDLLRVRHAWEECQSSRARWALQLQRLDLPITDEPFAAVILCTAAREKVDKRTRSKWSRVLRYAMEYKTNAEPLAPFIRRKGGINKCAARFARWVGRYGRH